MKVNWDGVGIATSILCAIHCLILPLALTSVPLMGVNVVHNGWFEWFMIVLAFTVGVYALSHGYKKHHQNKWPLLLFCVGFVLLVYKQFDKEWEIYFLLPALIFMISAHFVNYRISKKSYCQSPHHAH